MTTTITWPDRLPLPTFDGYAVQPQDAVARTDMESGAARVRRRYTSIPSRIPVRWRFGPTEFGIFESWFRWMVSDGAQWFSIELLGGMGMVGHEARFIGDNAGSYKAQPQRGSPGSGPRWIVTALLEIRERPVMSGDTLNLMMQEDLAGLTAAVLTAHDAIHFILPGTDVAGILQATADFHQAVHHALSNQGT